MHSLLGSTFNPQLIITTANCESSIVGHFAFWVISLPSVLAQKQAFNEGITITAQLYPK